MLYSILVFYLQNQYVATYKQGGIQAKLLEY